MAIPVRATIICPNCGASEDVTFGDTSIGPRGRTSPTPVYTMFKKERWPQTRREEDGKSVTYLSCASCGEQEFNSLPQLARRRH